MSQDDAQIESETAILLVNTTNLNLREGPGTYYQVIERLTYGQELILLSENGDWLEVKSTDDEQIGFVYRKYVRRKE
jgi:uncharacterized protein YraI